ncbi:MAG: hypothetical protein ACKVRN_07315 [Pyrinomonadaceae bacterium]
MRYVLFLVVILAAGVVFSFGQALAVAEERIPWSLTVVVLDGADQLQQAEIPVKEAVEFIEAHSRFVFTVRYVTSSAVHGYTPYRVGADKNKDKIPDETAYAMMLWNLPSRAIRPLPVSTSYLFLYKLMGKRPVQAGSALPIGYGLMKGGKQRPYATIPVDQWWFVNTPNQGFKSWAAQIVTHEINNTIQAKIEARPYKCGQLLATQGTPGNIHEAERLTKLTDKCYVKLGKNE